MMPQDRFGYQARGRSRGRVIRGGFRGFRGRGGRGGNRATFGGGWNQSVATTSTSASTPSSSTSTPTSTPIAQQQVLPTHAWARSGGFTSATQALGIVGSSADPGSSNATSPARTISAGQEPEDQWQTVHWAPAPQAPAHTWETMHTHHRSPSPRAPAQTWATLLMGYRRRAPSPQAPAQRWETVHTHHRTPSPQVPAQTWGTVQSNHRAPTPHTPTPSISQSRSSSASPPPNPYALAEEASVLLEVFCQSLNEDAGSADHTQNRELLTGARDNVNKILDTLWGKEETGPAQPLHEDQDANLMVYSGCVICYSSVAEMVLLPCNHLVLCLVRLLCGVAVKRGLAYCYLVAVGG